MRNLLTRLRRHGAPVAGLAALLLLGCLVLLASPGTATPHQVAAITQATPTNTSGTTPGVKRQLQDTGTPTAPPTDTPTPDPNATATPPATPTATDTPTPLAPTPTPTDTPIPPTPTATPIPTWHALTTFSGTGAANLGTISPAYPWRLTYTCVYTGTTQDFLTPYSPRNGNTDYATALCNAYHQSGLVEDGAGWPAPAGTYSLGVIASDPSAGVPAWTLTVEVWY